MIKHDKARGRHSWENPCVQLLMGNHGQPESHAEKLDICHKKPWFSIETAVEEWLWNSYIEELFIE